MAETEKLKIDPSSVSKNGGAREGAGRKKGGVNKDLQQRREVLRRFRERVANMADELLHAQANLALGVSYLICVETVTEGKTTRKISSVVEDKNIIKQYFDGKLDNNGNEYYYISTKAGDSKAIDSLLDRTFGKATQVHALDEESEPLTSITVNFVNKYEPRDERNQRSPEDAGDGSIQENNM